MGHVTIRSARKAQLFQLNRFNSLQTQILGFGTYFEVKWLHVGPWARQHMHLRSRGPYPKYVVTARYIFIALGVWIGGLTPNAIMLDYHPGSYLSDECACLKVRSYAIRAHSRAKSNGSMA
jgi:hypothetical protein